MEFLRTFVARCLSLFDRRKLDADPVQLPDGLAQHPNAAREALEGGPKPAELIQPLC
jgi:hypothetical protein